MDAFTVGAPLDDRRSRAEHSCEFYLPDVSCNICDEVWADTEVWYPSCRLKAGANVARYSDDVTVSIDELKKLRRLVATGDRRLKLLPGAGISVVTAKLPKKPTDFVWCGFKMLARESVLKVLKMNGLSVPSGPSVLLPNGTKTEYVPLELDPVRLYSDATLSQLTLTFCSGCDSCEMKNLRAKLTSPRGFVRSRIPEEQGLVRVYESPATIATPMLIDIAKIQGFSGIEFEKFGVYV